MISFLKDKVFKTDVGILVSSTGLSQLLLICVVPILTRLYTPTDYGYFGLFLSFINVGSMVLCLRYEVAIVATKNKKEMHTLLFMCSCFLGILSLLCSLFYYSLIHFKKLGFGVMPTYSVFFVFGSLLVMGGYQIVRYYCLRTKQYKFIAKTIFVQNSGRSLFPVAFGFLNMKLGLIFGDLLGRLVMMVGALKSLFTNTRKVKIRISRRDILATAKKYIQFPLISMPSSVIDVIAFALPIPFITDFYGLKYAGLYALATRLLSFPIALLTQNIADVFHSYVAESMRQKSPDVRKMFFQTTYKLCLLALPFTILIILVAPWSGGFLFGQKWHAVGMLIAYIVPWTAAQFIVSPLSRIVFVIGGQALKLIYDFTALFCLLGSFFIGRHLHFGFMKVIFLLSVSNIGAYVIYYMLLCYIVNRYVKRVSSI